MDHSLQNRSESVEDYEGSLGKGGYSIEAGERRVRTPVVGLQRPRRSFYAISAGWMIVIAGVLSIVNGFRTLMNQSSWNILDVFVDVNRYSACAFIIVAFGIVAIIGGISAIRGWGMSLALAGAALGVVGGGIIGFWLCIIAILFIFLSGEDL